MVVWVRIGAGTFVISKRGPVVYVRGGSLEGKEECGRATRPVASPPNGSNVRRHVIMVLVIPRLHL